MAILFEDTFDSFNSGNYTLGGQGTLTTTGGVLKASSYGTGASWHGPELTRTQSVTGDFKITNVINWDNTGASNLGYLYIYYYLSNGDILLFGILDSQGNSRSYEFFTSKDGGSSLLYYSGLLTSTNKSIIGDIWEVSKVGTTITLKNNGVQVGPTVTSVGNLTSVRMDFKSFSTFNPILTQEIQSFKIEGTGLITQNNNFFNFF